MLQQVKTNQNVTVDYQDPMVHGDSNIQSIFTKLDEDKQTIEQQIYVNPLKTATNTKVDIAGSQVDDYGNIKLEMVAPLLTKIQK